MMLFKIHHQPKLDFEVHKSKIFNYPQKSKFKKIGEQN